MVFQFLYRAECTELPFELPISQCSKRKCWYIAEPPKCHCGPRVGISRWRASWFVKPPVWAWAASGWYATNHLSLGPCPKQQCASESSENSSRFVCNIFLFGPLGSMHFPFPSPARPAVGPEKHVWQSAKEPQKVPPLGQIWELSSFGLTALGCIAFCFAARSYAKTEAWNRRSNVGWIRKNVGSSGPLMMR